MLIWNSGLPLPPPSNPFPDDLAVTFVHGYQDLTLQLGEDLLPALWNLRPGGEQSTYNYPFPRTPSDFRHLSSVIHGPIPDDAPEFERLPRIGLTGIKACGDHLYAGSWNGVYEIHRSDLSLQRIITHPLMCDLHGIDAVPECLVTTLPCKDTVVLTDYNGDIIDHFTIHRDLSVSSDPKILEVDWRFIGKMYRGSVGCFHFNHVQKFGSTIYLTSRSASCMVQLDLNTLKASLRLLNLHTPSMLHDGKRVDERFHFTSVDGKVFICEDAQVTGAAPEEISDASLYNRDMVSNIVRLNEVGLKDEPNWCRGVEVGDSAIYTTIDGRYGSDLSFGVVGVDRTEHQIIGHHRLPWKDVGDESLIRHVTGFDICHR